jgi:predicted secreted protein
VKTEAKWYLGLGAAFTAFLGWLYFRPHPSGWGGQDAPFDLLNQPMPGGRGTSPTFVGEESNGQTVRVGVGESLFVRLPSNPSTGYGWEIASISPALGAPKIEEMPGAGVGASGWTRFIWDMTPNMMGTQRLQLAYVAPGRGGAAAKTFSLTLNVG